MPAVGSDWSDDQIIALVKYTTTLVKHSSDEWQLAPRPPSPPTAPTGAAAASPRG